MPAPEDSLLRELMQTFKTEAADHLQTLNQTLLRLERQPEEAKHQELLKTAFRAAHSLKGAARAVSMEDVESLAHDLESVLQQARDAKLLLNAGSCDVLYDTLDAIEQLLAGQSIDLDNLRARLAGVGAESGEGASSESSQSIEEPVESPLPDRGTVTLGEETIRVAVDKLDDLMAQAGELIVSKISAEQRLIEMQNIYQQAVRWAKTWREIRALLPRIGGDVGQQLTDILTRHYDQLQSLTRQINSLDQAISRDTLRLDMVANTLQDQVRRVRMVPFQSLALVLERAVRDAAHSEGKQVTLQIKGGEVELDKKVLETLKDPLLHLLRNAASHGIESPDERQAAGKPAEGRIVVAVQQRGSEVRILVHDDGRGFDLDALRQAGTRSGMTLDERASADEIIALAFLPGITTAHEVTAMSGRGIGLDVVRQQLETLQGRIAVKSTPGKGTSFQLFVPVSLTMTRGLLVRCGAERYAIPLLSVEKILELENGFTVEGQPMITVDQTPLPLVSLAAVLGRPAAPENDRALVVIVGVAEQRMAFLVDDVLTEQELAVKPLGRPLRRVRNVVGAALLGSGEPVVILNPADLIKAARGVQTPILMLNGNKDQEAKPPVRVLVVDDSITTRTLERNILEAAGYEVITATDGLEALQRLKENTINVVVADIQMPNMDGITLTRTIRESNEHKEIPLILVTSLENREDRERGMVAGADAYIVKRGFDQAELLRTIERFLS